MDAAGLTAVVGLKYPGPHSLLQTQALCVDQTHQRPLEKLKLAACQAWLRKCWHPHSLVWLGCPRVVCSALPTRVQCPLGLPHVAHAPHLGCLVRDAFSLKHTDNQNLGMGAHTRSFMESKSEWPDDTRRLCL